MKKRIAFLGLGAMGSRMAARLLQAGHEVHVYNRSSQKARALAVKGAIPAATPCGAAAKAEVVISMVTNDEASKTVWMADEDGAIHGLNENTIVIEAGTVTTDWVQTLQQETAGRCAGMLDAPVAGSRPQAEAGALIFLVGGPKDLLEQVQEVLSCMGSTIHYAGSTGAGMRMKLAVNAFFGIQVAALSELTGMLRKAGLDEARALECLAAMPITSPALKGIAGLIGSRNFAPLFPIDLVAKDLGYAMSLAHGSGAQTPVTQTALDSYRKAQEQGYGNENIAGVARLYL